MGMSNPDTGVCKAKAMVISESSVKLTGQAETQPGSFQPVFWTVTFLKTSYLDRHTFP